MLRAMGVAVQQGRIAEPRADRGSSRRMRIRFLSRARVVLMRKQHVGERASSDRLRVLRRAPPTAGRFLVLKDDMHRSSDSVRTRTLHDRIRKPSAQMPDDESPAFCRSQT